MNFYIDRKGLIKRFYVLLTYILLQIYVVFWQILEGKMNLCYITTILRNSGDAREIVGTNETYVKKLNLNIIVQRS